MTDIVKSLKALMGYGKVVDCNSCKFKVPDLITDNFGYGDQCGRNVDVFFKVSKGFVCLKWEAKDENN